MSNKAITIGLISVIFLFFIGYFAILNMSFDGGTKVTNLLNGISQAAYREQWGKARAMVKELNQELRYKKYLVMLNYANGDMADFLATLARLEAAVGVKAKNDTVIESAMARELWTNFWQVVPQP